MDKVAVLMSTYNGGDYIEEQIKSIYDQTQDGLKLYIRDDGSDPVFVNRLKMLQEKYSFVLYQGENVGFLKSFWWLLDHVKDAEYYSFADQDDIWYPDKTQRAVTWLDAQKKTDVPLLYHCAYLIRNEATGASSDFYYKEEEYDFRRSITENHYSGFAMVVNQTMRQYMLKGDVSQIDYHDWWAANIVKAFGVAYNDQTVGAIHRAHQENVTRITLKSRIRWVKRMLTQESDIKKRMKEFEHVFGDRLSEKNEKWVKRFAKETYSFPDAVYKCFYPKRFRPVVSSELVLRMLMLIGRV